MAGWNFVALASVALILLLNAGDRALAREVQHPGQVVVVDKTDSKQPIKLDIRVWSQSKETGGADCPAFGDSPLYATTSDNKEGRFVLKVDSTRRTYTTTYCARDIFPRVDTALVNEPGPIVPMPVEVYPKQYDRAAYKAALTEKIIRLIGALNDFAYYQRVSQEDFKKAMDEVRFRSLECDQSRARLLEEFGDLARRWSSPK